jgi:hypothetical protein
VTEREIIAWLLALAYAAEDSPLRPWRAEHPITQACLDRTCFRESCDRRDAIAEFAYACQQLGIC